MVTTKQNGKRQNTKAPRCTGRRKKGCIDTKERVLSDIDHEEKQKEGRLLAHEKNRKDSTQDRVESARNNFP